MIDRYVHQSCAYVKCYIGTETFVHILWLTSTLRCCSEMRTGSEVLTTGSQGLSPQPSADESTEDTSSVPLSVRKFIHRHTYMYTPMYVYVHEKHLHTL